MTTMHPGFRKLVLRNIPQLDNEDLNDYDGLLAYRWQLEQEKSLASNKPTVTVGVKSLAGPRALTPRQEVERMITTTTRLANTVIDGYRPQFDALHELWVARRNAGLRQGGTLQVPRNLQELAALAGSLATYYRVQIKTFPTLALNRLKNFPWRSWVLVGVFVSLALLALASLDKGKDREGHNPPQPPDSTQVQP